MDEKLGEMEMKNVSSIPDMIAKASFVSRLLLATTLRWVVITSLYSRETEAFGRL